jgi:hypothetical protein
VKALTQSQIHWANEIASSASSGEIASAVSLIRKLRLRLEADELNRWRRRESDSVAPIEILKTPELLKTKEPQAFFVPPSLPPSPTVRHPG